MKRQLRSILIGALALGWTAAGSSFANVMTFANTASQTLDASVADPPILIPVNFGPGNWMVEKVVAKLTFQKCESTTSCQANESFFEEIIFRLTNPSAIAVTLLDAPDPQGGVDMVPSGTFEISFDDGASAPIDRSTLTPGTPSVAKPDLGLMASFNQDLANGDWELYAEDLTGGNPLIFLRVDLEITAADATPNGQAPEPGTLSLLGLGIVGLGALSRRNKV